MNTLAALLQSRKFFVGTLTVLAVGAATFLRAKGLIPADALLPTISGICLTGSTTIASIAWEDASKTKPSPVVAPTNVTVQTGDQAPTPPSP